jgi:uncharacterized integral membrane protein (TIGR00697 family)
MLYLSKELIVAETNMNNELLFFVRLLVDFAFVLLAFRMGKEWLFASIIVNLIMISTFGGIIVNLFGFTTNVGNVFYAAVFLAIHLLAEHYGKKEALKTVWVGFWSIFIFIALSELTVNYGFVSPDSLAAAASFTFHTAPRIALASMVAYIITQYLNVYLYDYLHKRTGQAKLWLRDNLSNILGQLIDSVLFFTIAFLDVLAPHVLLQSMMFGFFIKILAGFIGTGFLYLSYPLKKL